MTTNTHESLAAPILVVEDSDEDFDTLREAAVAAGVTRMIRRVMSGGDCLALLRGEDGVSLPVLPALILMDLNSHGIDGREALVAIKTDDGLKDIPMVVLTTSANPKDVTFCFQAGANAYHVKPVRHDQYLMLLGSLLHYWLESVTPRALGVRID
jgi:CheY-like chemotaxis protein